MIGGMLLLLLLLLAFSLFLRMQRRRQGNNEIKASPFSLAVQELVSTAGGVYLSLIMLTSFLKLDIPEIVSLCGVSFDPLAGIAMGVAVVQPLCALIFYKLTK
ncbi:MAG: hypothetical protein LLG02_16010 [Pelosinus sp.]|nr:hypothetical protein [Pelosinus sp.]